MIGNSVYGLREDVNMDSGDVGVIGVERFALEHVAQNVDFNLVMEGNVSKIGDNSVGRRSGNNLKRMGGENKSEGVGSMRLD